MTGRLIISLNGQTAQVRSYQCQAQKVKILEQWRKLYGPAYFKAEITDEPDQEIKKEESKFKNGEAVKKFNLKKVWKVRYPYRDSF